VTGARRLAPAGWMTAPETRAVIAALEAAQAGSARFVGGCVRNALMGRPIDDIDIATPLLPDDVISALRAAGLKFAPTGLAHGTVTAIVHGRPFEITTLRKDVETDGRHAVVAFTTDWAQDAARRDFRLNAIYASPDGALFDPVGGVEDALAGRVVFIGDAQARIREDYLRILRFFRLTAQCSQTVDQAGLVACGALSEGIGALSAERVWKEIKKLLAAPDPRLALAAMAASGILGRILPEARGLGVCERLVAVDSDSFFEPDALLRLLALMPDDPQAARDLASRLKLANAERDRLVAALGPWPNGAAACDTRIVSYLSARQVRRALYHLGAQAFRDRVRLSWARDGNPRTHSQWRALLAMSEGWVRPVLKLTGEQVTAAGVPRGARIGAVMREVEAWWIDADFPDDELSLIERLKAVAQALG
jgi:poly(A) polymerase